MNIGKSLVELEPRWAAVVLIGVSISCTGDLGIEGNPLPDLSGSWRLELEARPTALHFVTQGICRFDPMDVELERGVTDRVYVGRHAGGRMECTGFDPSTTEWTRLGDTTVVIPRDGVNGNVRPCANLVCTGPPTFELSFPLMMRNLSLYAGLNSSRMEGHEGFYLIEDSVRFAYSWSLERMN